MTGQVTKHMTGGTPCNHTYPLYGFNQFVLSCACPPQGRKRRYVTSAARQCGKINGHEDAHQMSKIVDDSEDGLREEATLTRYVNTTPHAINILAGSDINRGEADVTIESSNVSIRVKSESEVECLTIVGSLFVEIRKRKFTSVTYLEDGVEMPLPNQQEGVTYIVSRITAEALPTRDDLLMVDGTVRDDDGRIIGCTGFAQL